jgi:BirA family transcriptional regulator, biotin operon repressor / biotin---[acetyl-CoA-carboxylase] ligase
MIAMTEFSQQQFEIAYQKVRSTGIFPCLPPHDPVLYWFETLASTNQTLWELLDQGAAPGTVVIARQQAAGRGQWGRQWQSLPGGLYLSLAIVPELPITEAAQLTLTSAWGIATALREAPTALDPHQTTIPVQIKWLNDLVLSGRKLGGILTETRLQSSRITRAVVGVGINWANPVPEPGIHLQSFFEQQATPSIESIEMLAAIVVYGLMASHQQLNQQGIEPILSGYQELFSHRGASVLVNDRRGKVVGVSATGNLRICFDVETPASEICLKPGTISLGYNLIPKENKTPATELLS